MIVMLMVATLASGNDSITGNWVSGCQEAKEDTSLDVSLSFDDEGRMETLVRIYQGEDCEAPAARVRAEAAYSVGDSSDAVEGASELDLEADSVFLAPLTREAALTMNLAKICGRRDWKKDVEREITGCEQAGAPEKGEIRYDLFAIEEKELEDGTVSTVMRTGLDDEDHDGKTEEGRPVMLREEAFTREE